MTTGKLKIHTENVLPIIKKWLYTEKEIFIRELVSNSCDAITKLSILEGENEKARIDITVDKEQKTLTFEDTGIGMTADEVEKYIAKIAFSSAEEFVHKYKDQSSEDPIIGHFGLGFFSAYMVAKQVTIDTLSYTKEAEPALWICDGTVNYTLKKGKRKERGTTVTLFLDDDAKEYLEENRLSQLLKHYCAYLPYPIYLNKKRINERDPLWLTPPSKATDKEYLLFYRDLYPLDPDPIFWIHLNVDYPFHLQGILYFPKVEPRFDWSKNHIKLFSSRVFVSNSCKEILPEYLTMLKGALDSPDIPLNVSRSSLQLDATVRKLSAHISKKVADRLLSLHRTDPKKYQEIWPNIELVVKLGIIQDDRFYEKIKPALIFKTLSGASLTAEEYLEKHGKKLFYTSDENIPSQLLDLYKNSEILIANSPVDSALMNHLEQKLSPATFQRIDSGLDEHLLNPAGENTLLDSEGKTQGAQIAAFAKTALDNDNLEIEAKSLTSDSLPALIVLDESLRRLRDHLALTGQVIPPGLSSKKTFILNTQSNLVRSIYKIKESDPELAKELIHQLYDLSLLSQKEFDPSALTTFITRTTTLLEKLCRR